MRPPGARTSLTPERANSPPRRRANTYRPPTPAATSRPVSASPKKRPNISKSRASDPNPLRSAKPAADIVLTLKETRYGHDGMDARPAARTLPTADIQGHRRDVRLLGDVCGDGREVEEPQRILHTTKV